MRHRISEKGSLGKSFVVILKRLRLYFDTLRYLKLRQIVYQAYYRGKKIRRNRPVFKSVEVKPGLLQLEASIPLHPSFPNGSENQFIFLNREKRFGEKIDWNFLGFGKLWAYNLNYFDFLLQKDISIQEAKLLLDSFCEYPEHRSEGNEPYPISLRGINWIKFFSYRKVCDNRYDAVLFAHYQFLAKNLEYHLLGNHLLENGFSLLFGSYYFRSDELYRKAKYVLQTQLNEQVLTDGAHFELSPMYHQILLFRLLDCINLIKNNSWKKDSLLTFLKGKATKMVGWLKAVTFKNGDIPMVNDAAYGIAHNSRSIFDYAERLGIEISPTRLDDSGYRMIHTGVGELFVDIGNIGPDYIPGHAHSDTLSFLLYVNNQPVIVDTGTSTYETGMLRHEERSTESHNTVMINGRQQSEIWGSFRVGRRAKVIHQEETSNSISASHDGYKFMGFIHRRTWQWNKNTISITDQILGEPKGVQSVARFHFHPEIKVTIEKGDVQAGPMELSFSQAHVEIQNYNYATGFNVVTKAPMIKVSFSNHLKTTMRLLIKLN